MLNPFQGQPGRRFGSGILACMRAQRLYIKRDTADFAIVQGGAADASAWEAWQQ